MITRTAHLDAMSDADNQSARDALHRAYYAQFVTPVIRNRVVKAIGIDRLCAEFRRDEHLNGIELKVWDSLTTTASLMSNKLMRDRGDYPMTAGLVCVLKEAARQAIEEPGFFAEHRATKAMG